jgi:2-methylcitrate dehydratase PrpD
VWFDSARLPLAQAVRVNAMLSDAAASDDSDLRNVAHTGTLVSAIGLGAGEFKNILPRDVLLAMAVGYEAAGRFGDMVRGGRPGLHASFIVALGGTVAVARLLGLTVEQMAHAISLTASSIGGILIGTDSWDREYMAGNAALAAVQAALAAQRGFTANPDLLEAKGGFLDTFGNNKVDLSAVTRPLSAPWDIERYLAIKLVPGAHALHSSLDAAIQASKQANVPAGDIVRIIHSGPPKTSIAYEPAVPKDMVEAIHSLPYFLATGVADRTFDWSHITLEKMRRPEIARLIGLVEYEAVPASAHYDWNWGGRVTLVTKAGARFSSTVDAPRGSGPSGIEWTDVDTKYRALIGDSGLPASRQAQILAAVHDFEHAGSVSAVIRLLRR